MDLLAFLLRGHTLRRHPRRGAASFNKPQKWPPRMIALSILVIIAAIATTWRYLNIRYLKRSYNHAIPIPSIKTKDVGHRLVKYTYEVRDNTNHIHSIFWIDGTRRITFQHANNTEIETPKLAIREYVDSIEIRHDPRRDLIYIVATGQGFIFHSYTSITEYSLAKREITHSCYF